MSRSTPASSCAQRAEPTDAEKVVARAMFSAVLNHRMSLPAAQRDYWQVPDANHRLLMARAAVAALADAGMLAVPVTIGPEGDR